LQEIHKDLKFPKGSITCSSGERGGGEPPKTPKKAQTKKT